MRHFSIDSDNHITVHSSRRAAKETGNPVFSSEIQLSDVIGPDNKRLLEIWNSLPGVKAVAKFANRKAATERIWKAIQELGGPVAAEPAPEHPAESASDTPIPAVETPFDLPEAKPIPQEIAPESTTEPAVVPVAGQPGAAPEGTATVSAQTPDVAPPAAKAGRKATRTAKPVKAPKELKPAKSEGVREGSKTAQVVALLKRASGATLPEIMEKMGWQRHTVRGFMAGAMKKAGFAVESFKPEGGERTYRINL
jgi:hypothetical protein